MARRILIVDDEPNIRQMMRLTMESSGYEVAEAADGADALRLFGDGAGWDVVLLDQRMPGLEGLDVLRTIRQRDPAARVVMVSAFGSIELAVDAMKLGATDFVRKPMVPETLRRAVEAALEKAPFQAQRAAPSTAPGDATPAAPAPLEIWTTNGFFVRRVDADRIRPDSTRHEFRVRQGRDGEEQTVVVDVSMREVDRVSRLSRRTLRPGGAFWREQAALAVVNHLWRDATPPADGRLTLDRITSEAIGRASNAPDD